MGKTGVLSRTSFAVSARAAALAEDLAWRCRPGTEGPAAAEPRLSAPVTSGKGRPAGLPAGRGLAHRGERMGVMG